MNEHVDAEVEAVAAEIAEYLAARPNASDSVEGIARWWLVRQRYATALGTVTKALDHLVASGVVIGIVTGNGNTIYARVQGATGDKHLQGPCPRRP